MITPASGSSLGLLLAVYFLDDGSPVSQDLCLLGILYKNIAETEGNDVYSQNGASSTSEC